MTEIQPPDGQINGGGALIVTSTENVGTKRRRKPSVRLGDIGGDNSFDSLTNHRPPPRRPNKLPWNQQPPYSKHKSSKPQALSATETANRNLDAVAVGSWRKRVRDSKSIATAKRVRSNWAGFEEEDVDDDYDDDNENEFRGIDSDSPRGKENSKSMENDDEIKGGRYRRGISRGGGVSDGPSDTDAWNNNDDSNSERNGVKVWLNQLGLGRYYPVFEVHEVDDEVLPMLTLEDLKDMGINAVGSRRKMYSYIQKLGKGFS